jgi:UDP-N-acetyl-D-mannosaminouronate:lipid I N-acetyl-D-mannosaminouronosyltransferase
MEKTKLQMSIDPISVNGVNIYPFRSFEKIVEYTINKKTILIATNARKIINNDPRLKALINENIGYVDGVGARVAIKKKTGIRAAKLPGCELWLEIIKKHKHNKSFYFIGATTEVINDTISKLKIDFPGLDVIGFRNGFLRTQEEKTNLFEDLQQKKPDVVFVAMGSPRQEYFMEECLKVYPALYQGLGGSFDVYVGIKKRPPQFFINLGLEGFLIALTEFVKKPKERLIRASSVLKFFLLLYKNKI